jgi:predicted O-linked N-acetylglucosamine transferase (SPINDLY family)
MIGHWATILLELPRSRIVVQSGTGSGADERIRTAFRTHGIDLERVTLLGWRSVDEYLRGYHGLDICLDTYPYTGGFTTADALWMGVPVVTLAGPSCVTRQGIAALALAGLQDLVTDTPAAYIATAIRLARDLPRLRELRRQLRERFKGTIGNVERFTRQLEAAYLDMWGHSI